MHPDYEAYRKEPKEPSKQYSFRAPDRLSIPIDTIAIAEGDTRVDILIEGAARVCLSREPNSESGPDIDYSFTRKRRLEAQSIVTLHLPEDLDRRLQRIAAMEEKHVTQLIYEGMGRVIINRRSNIGELEARQRARHILEYRRLRNIKTFSEDA